MDGKKKRVFRKKAFSKLRSIERRGSYIYDKKALNCLRTVLSSMLPKSVMIYNPMPAEVDVRPLIVNLRRMGIAVYVPFMVDESFILVKYRLPLYRKQFGVYEPKISKQYRKREIDIAIVPVLGIDRTFRRIGFGKGMYDRFFEKEKKYIGQVIFIQRVLCFSSDVITDSHDMDADCIVTGEGCLVKENTFAFGCKKMREP